MFLAFCIDVVVCYKASAIQFNEEAAQNDQNNVDENGKTEVKTENDVKQQDLSQSTC